MSVVDLREAFNAVAEPRYSAARALMHYERDDKGEWQVLTFGGTGQAGAPFEIQSDKIAPNADVMTAARATAQRLLDQKEPAA